MHVQTILFGFLFAKVSASLQPLPDELSSRLSLAQCVAEASELYFKEGELVLLSLPVQEVSVKQASAVLLNSLLLNELFRRSSFTFIIKKTTESRKKENYLKAVDNYLIQVRNLSELAYNLQVLQGYSSWNPHAKFIIISVALYGNNSEAASVIVQQLWQKKVANGVVLLPDQNRTDIFHTFSWFPFSSGHCGDGFAEINIIDTCRYGKFSGGEDWFPDKIPHDLNGCPVRVRAVIWPPYILEPVGKVIGSEDQYTFKDGLEIRLMNTMAGMANFSPVYTVSERKQDWGYITEEGDATGAMRNLKVEEVDIAIGSFAASIETHLHFDVITYSIPESLKWCVPHAQHMSQWKNLLVIVTIGTWGLLLVAYILVSLCMWRLGLFQKNESSAYTNLINSFQNIFAVLVNTTVNIQPRANSLRILFMLWIFFSLHFGVGYQTSLVGVFTTPRYDSQIATIDDIFENNLNLWFLSTTKRYFVNNNDWVSIKVLSGWNDCADISVCLHKTAYDRDSATCTPRLYKKFMSGRYVNKNNEPLLHCFEDSVVTFPLEMLLRKGYPLTEYFNTLVHRIISAGLVAHWEKEILQNTHGSNREDDAEDGSTDKSGITMNHMAPVFAQLAVGYGLGFVSFLFEIFVHRRYMNKLKIAKYHRDKKKVGQFWTNQTYFVFTK